MTKKILVGLSLCFAVSAVAPAASADPTKKDNDYGYEFKDDILNAGNTGPMTAQIRVRQTGRRELLLRPRVHFVAEMLKSVENM